MLVVSSSNGSILTITHFLFFLFAPEVSLRINQNLNRKIDISDKTTYYFYSALSWLPIIMTIVAAFTLNWLYAVVMYILYFLYYAFRLIIYAKYDPETGIIKKKYFTHDEFIANLKSLID